MSPEYYNSRNQETYQVELISHKNSSKGRSQKQRTRLGGKKNGKDLVYCLTSLLSPTALPCLPPHFQEGWSNQFRCCCLTQLVQLQTLQMVFQQSISERQGGKADPYLAQGPAGCILLASPASALQCSFKRHIAWPPCKWAVRKSGSPQKGSKQFEMGLESSKDSSSLTWLVTE